jgi:hypothetical protein
MRRRPFGRSSSPSRSPSRPRTPPELDPNNAVAHYLIAQVQYRQGHFLLAAQSLSKAMRLRASSPLHPWLKQASVTGERLYRWITLPSVTEKLSKRACRLG